MTSTDLKAAQSADHAARLVSGKSPATKKAAEAVPSVVTTTAVVVEEKRSAAERVSAVVSAKQALAERTERRKVAEREKAVQAATRLFQTAQEWPRCGQGWPASAAEDRADALLKANLKQSQAIAAC